MKSINGVATQAPGLLEAKLLIIPQTKSPVVLSQRLTLVFSRLICFPENAPEPST